MDRGDLQRLSKDELIELVMRLQRPDKTSRTSSKPPSTDRKETRENSRPGGAKPGHEPHNRRLADNPDEVRDHKPILCGRCGGAFGSDIDGRLIGEYDEIEIPPFKPHVVRHRRFACQCAGRRDADVVWSARSRAGHLSFGCTRERHVNGLNRIGLNPQQRGVSGCLK
jgi:transposase